MERQHQEALDHQGIDKVDKECTDHRDDDKGLWRGTITRGHGLHVGDRRRGGAHPEPAMPCGHDRGAHRSRPRPERDEYGERDDAEGLNGKDGEQRAGEIEQLPQPGP